MEIITQYDIGQKVYTAKEEPKYSLIKCDLCEEKGQVKLDKKDITIKCPKCKGAGVIETGSVMRRAVQEYAVTNILVFVDRISSAAMSFDKNEEKTGIHYTLNFKNTVPENELFPTREEAQEHAYRENKRLEEYGKKG